MEPAEEKQEITDDAWNDAAIMAAWLFVAIFFLMLIQKWFGWGGFAFVWFVVVACQLPLVWGIIDKSKPDDESKEMPEWVYKMIMSTLIAVLGPTILIVYLFGAAGWVADTVVDFTGTRRRKTNDTESA